MSILVLEIITAAFQKINAIDETQSPSAEQLVIGLATLNDAMADLYADGIPLGWFPQTDPAARAPLRPRDVRAVKLYLAGCLSTHYGLPMSLELKEELESVVTRLRKRALNYAEANFSELPRQQGPWNNGYY